jgi:hypothetical protein
MRQIEAKIRKEESGEFKKGNYKASSKYAREILPFNAGIEPFINLPKKTGIVGVSSNKRLLYRDSAKAVQREQRQQQQSNGDSGRNNRTAYNQHSSYRQLSQNQRQSSNVQRQNATTSFERGGA